MVQAIDHEAVEGDMDQEAVERAVDAVEASIVTSQHILYYCTYYSVSFTCTVHCTHYTYCTLYI